MDSVLVKGTFIIEKFPGKGGWSYVDLSHIPLDPNNPFGWVIVKGFIDDYKLKQFKLMPMGQGGVFMSLRADLRKKLNKQAGDSVYLELYNDASPTEIPGEILECFKGESAKLYETFVSFTEGERKSYLDWIYKAKTVETKAERIASLMDRLSKGLKFYD
jgi:hypothetical protein